jgi:hypothetical protein
MEKQTAVNWFVDKVFGKNGLIIYDKLIQEAKEMEKKQIEQAFIDGEGGYNPDNGNVERMAYEYYNKTYNQ